MTGEEDNKTKDNSMIGLCVRILVTGFLVNLVWENAQAFLYVGYGGFWEHFWVCFVASVIDALVILLVYVLLALVYKHMYWPRHNSLVRYAVVALIGGALAVSFEIWALEKEEWTYTGLMPVVPGLEVGFSPLIQLMVLPVLTYNLSLKSPHRHSEAGADKPKF